MAVISCEAGVKETTKRLNRRIRELTRELEQLIRAEEDVTSLEDDSDRSLDSSELSRINDLESTVDRLVRLKEVLELVPVSKSTWWAGVKSGRYPKPVHHLGPRITAWRMSEVMHLVNGGCCNEI